MAPLSADFQLVSIKVWRVLTRAHSLPLFLSSLMLMLAVWAQRLGKQTVKGSGLRYRVCVCVCVIGLFVFLFSFFSKTHPDTKKGNNVVTCYLTVKPPPHPPNEIV